MSIGRSLLIALCVAVVGGCVNQQKKELASDVAKNWCLAIRASQVLPTYPLTEDLQPGDLFVVQQPIEDEVKLYTEKGFLPLTHLIYRVPVDGYMRFYAHHAYGVQSNDDTPLPAFWQFGQKGALPSDPTTQQSSDKPQPPLPTNWSIAPRGSFPSYSFSVDTSAGFQAGLPVHGVPIALGVLGSDHAEATVTLGDAYTFGIDESTLTGQVRKWSEGNDTLKAYSPIYNRDGDGTYQVSYTYLRLVTRVYYVQKVTVTVRQTADRSGEIDYGVAQNLKLSAATTQPGSDMQSILDTLNNGLSGTTTKGANNSGGNSPATGNGSIQSVASAAGKAVGAASVPIGASLKFANVTASSVSMDETFDRPLVIGYLAVDIPVGYDGQLGTRPVATQRRIEEAASGARRHTVHEWAENSPSSLEDLQSWVIEGNNTAWLQENGFQVAKDKSGQVDSQATAHQLWDELRHMGGLTEMSWAIFNRPRSQKFNRLNARIIGEIIERPPGTGIDFVIEANRQLKDLASQVSAQQTAPATNPAAIKPVVDKAQMVQDRISKLRINESEKQKLLNDLNKVKQTLQSQKTDGN